MVLFLFFAFSLFIFGSCIGSFCGVLMETSVKRSFWTGRSQCLSCHTHLRWYEMIPVLSYLLQQGKCRTCRAHIPAWILSIELMMGLLWLLFGTILFAQGYSVWIIVSHLIIISMILVLAMEDIRSFTIPDRLSLPIICLTFIIIILSSKLYDSGLLPSLKYSLFGGVVGMLFYILQMIIPSLLSVLKKKKYRKALHIIFIPFFMPFWLVIKIFFGEKRADKIIPSISLLDNLPTWVGGGDVRLGILLGLMLGPREFWWTIGIGYTLGTLFWFISRLLGKKHLDVLPVAPLLFLGFCATWLIVLLG